MHQLRRRANADHESFAEEGFWQGTILRILLVLVVQFGFLVMVGITMTKNAVFFTFASSFCYLIAHGYIAIYAIRRDSIR